MQLRVERLEIFRNAVLWAVQRPEARLKFEGRDDNLERRDFVEFSKRFGLPSKAVEGRLDRLLARAAPFVPRVKEIGYDARLTAQLTELMTKRLIDLR